MHIVDVIPFKERYSVTAAGAIALCVDQMAGVETGEVTVLGKACPDPLSGARLQPVPSFYLTWRFKAAYVMGWEALFYFEGLRRALRRAKPDVIHVHNRPLMAVMLQREFPEVPVFLFLHNDPMEMRELRPPKSIGDQLGILAGIIALSGWIEDRLYEAVPGVPRHLVQRIANVVATEAAAIPDDELFAGKEKVVLFVGRIVGSKGALPFAEAMAPLLDAHPDWRAVALGGFRMGTTDCSQPSEYQTAFLDAVKRHERLSFLGPRPFAETMDWMRRAAVLVVPSRHKEAFARVAVEGMFSGAALAVCKMGGALTEIAPEESGAVHFDAPAADQIAAAVGPLMADDADRLARARRGRAYAEAHYAPAALGRKIDELHRAALEQRQ
ncbi:glycosyltransferase family 4 protein [Zavarzinia sp.]|uniref:glycosyltransferase family 4 protein n=1 Tax=Zavarzinia sp. TaxID=2027920 RepID=UPI00356AAC81